MTLLPCSCHGQNWVAGLTDSSRERSHGETSISSCQIGLLLFPRMTQLDFTGPYEVFARLPDTVVHVVAKTSEPVRTDRGLVLFRLSPARIARRSMSLSFPAARASSL